MVLKMCYTFPTTSSWNGSIDFFSEETTYQGTFYFFEVFRGRPRGRRDDSGPNCLAVRCCQEAEPKGRSRAMLSRNAFNSASV